jgi:hypothetical protein
MWSSGPKEVLVEGLEIDAITGVSDRIRYMNSLVDREVVSLVIRDEISFLEKYASNCILSLSGGWTNRKVILLGIRAIIGRVGNERKGQLQVEGSIW